MLVTGSLWTSNLQGHMDLEELGKEKEMERGNGNENDRQSSRHIFIHACHQSYVN